AFHIYFLYFAIWNLADFSVHKDLFTLYVEFLSQERLIFVTLVVVFPIVTYQMFKFSHRIAGPLFRCRQVIREMAAGKIVQEFKPRQHDLLGGFFADLNTLIKESNARLGGNPNAPKFMGIEDSPPPILKVSAKPASVAAH